MGNNESTPFNILSLSGGGVRGLYTITVLAELEKYLAEKSGDEDYWIGQHFDLISGTSIGGILGLALASGVTARELEKVLDDNRKLIFPKTSFLKAAIGQLFSGKYSAEPLKKVIQEVVGEKKIGDLKTRVLVPAINASTGLVQTFKTPHHKDLQRDWRFKVLDVALATSAAPTYFPPHKIDSAIYVDGGLAANSPALMALHEARHFLEKDSNNIYLVSIGTMGQKFTKRECSKGRYGYLGWGLGEELIAISMSSTESLHNQIAQHELEDDRYLFIDSSNTPSNSEAGLELDNASDEAADILKAQAKSKAQYAINEPVLRSVFQHKALPPKFHYGPQKETPSAETKK